MLRNGDVMIQRVTERQPNRVAAGEVHRHGNLYLLPEAVGHCRTEVSPVVDGFSLIGTDYLPLRPLIEESRNADDRPALVLTFGLRGHSRFRAADGSEAAFSAGQLTVTSFHGSEGERRYAAGERISQLRLRLSLDAVRHSLGDEISERLFASGRMVNHVLTPYSRATRVLIDALMQTGSDVLMRQIHALNLLAQQRHLLVAKREKPLHPQDDLRLEQARAWMQTHLASTFSLATLAMAVGLSEYKLKQGFHRRFNTTPGKMLLQMRMEQAHRLLEQGYQVAQAGWQVGYPHANNFSVAFQRYFGRQASAVAGKKQ